MNMLTLGAAGIAAVLLAVWMKGVKAEYGIFVVIAAQLFFLFYGPVCQIMPEGPAYSLPGSSVSQIFRSAFPKRHIRRLCRSRRQILHCK